MSLLEASIFGLVQGVTEFLPVSSSAHLVLFHHLLGFREQIVFFDVVLHWGTLVSLFIYFAADIACLLRDSAYGISYLIRRKPMQQILDAAPHSRWALGIVVASLPTALMGIFFRDWFESLFSSLRATGLQLFVTTALLALTAFFQKSERGMDRAGWRDFLVIGFAQGISIIPGISRSGATIAAALFCGLKREDAFRFSFLLSIPAILGAAAVEAEAGLTAWQGGWEPLAAGFLVSALFGCLSLFFLARVLRRGRFHWFAVYTFLLGLLILKFGGSWE